MGCKTYFVKGKLLKFAETSDFKCLCTYPDSGVSNSDRIKSLALLGAAVALIDGGAFDNVPDGDYIFLPHDLPDFVVDSIRFMDIE